MAQTHHVGLTDWRPDLPDVRDHPYRAVQRAVLPPKVDLRPMCPPVVDQGQLGSCTANALAGAFGFIHRTAPPASRLFVYYNERVIEGTVRSDAGAMLRDGIKTLKNTGVCLEKHWPYDIAKFKLKPPATCFGEATTRRITSYQRLETVQDMQDCLASGFPFVFGFTVYDAFESDAVAKSGVLGMPGPGEKMIGGHAVCAVGYDLPSQRFIVRNSWGSRWGQKGHFTMPFDYLANRKLSDDFWTIRA